MKYLVQFFATEIIRFSVLLVLALLLLLSRPGLSADAQSADTVLAAAKIVGPIHTEGKRIVDSQNHVVRFLGVNSTGLEFGAGNEWHPGEKAQDHFFWATPEEQQIPQAYDLLARWGFNTVRLPVSWADLEPVPPHLNGSKIVHDWNKRYIAAVDWVISQYAQRGIVCIVSFHHWAWSPRFVHNGAHGIGMPPWLYRGEELSQQDAEFQFCFNSNPIYPGYSQQDGAIDACKYLSRHYAGNKDVVAFDLFNEMPHYKGFNLKQFYEREGSAIRSVNSDILLIFQEAHSKTPIEGKVQLPNIVYSIHFYPPAWDLSKPGNLSAREHIEKGLAKANAWNLPLYIGEFGKFGADDPEQYSAGLEKMMAACKQNNVSWTYFPLQPVMHGSIIKRNNREIRYPIVQALQTGF